MTATLPPTDPAAVQARLDDLFRSIDPDAPADRASALLRRYVEDYRLQREAVPAAGATPEVP